MTIREFIPLLIIGLAFLLVFVGVMLVIQPIKERNLMACLVAVDLAILVAVIFPLRWLLDWVAFELLLLLWILGGLIIGGIAYLAKLNYLVAVLIGVLVPLTILLVLGGSPNMEYGWGAYSVPLSVVGIAVVYALKSSKKILTLYVFSWFFLLVFTLFPYLMEELDSELTPPIHDIMSIVNYKFLITVIYVVLNFVILIISAFVERPRVLTKRSYQP
jgi:hypothetical protein